MRSNKKDVDKKGHLLLSLLIRQIIYSCRKKLVMRNKKRIWLLNQQRVSKMTKIR